MTNKGRINWKARAAELQERADSLEQAAEEWKALASEWRGRFHELQDQVVMSEARAGAAQRVEQPSEGGEDDVGDDLDNA